MADISLEPQIAANLANHLNEQGRLNGRNVNDIRALLTHSVGKVWDTPYANQFNDGSGAGWMIDIGDAFEGEALYAIVRRRNGQPFIQDVLDQDQLDNMSRQVVANSPALQQQSKQHPPSTPQAQAVAAQGIPQPAAVPEVSPPPPPPPEPKLTDPVLIRYKDDLKKQRVSRESTHGEYQAELQKLFAEGIKPESVEVWTEVKRPKVKIELG